MTAVELRQIILDDGAIFNARFHKDIASVASYVTERYEPVTMDEVGMVLANMTIDTRTGAVID